MISSFEFLQATAWQTLLLTLMHSLWIALAAAALLTGALRILSARQANLRYGLCVATLSGIVLATLTAGTILQYQAAPPQRKQRQVLSSGSEPRVRPDSETSQQKLAANTEHATSHVAAAPVVAAPDVAAESNRPQEWVPCLAAAWLLGVGLMLLRTLVRVLDAQRLTRGAPLVDRDFLDSLQVLQHALHMSRTIRVVTSEICRLPAVAGIFWPTLILPTCAVTGWPPEVLRAVLMHELAHIRRHDYLVNLLQLLVESVLYFNPAVWWVSRQIRIEREACCDGVVVRLTSRPLDYSRILAELATSPDGTMFPVAVPGMGGPAHSTLLDRIRRILSPEDRPEIQVSAGGLLLGLLVAGVALSGMWRGTTAAVAVAARLLSPAQQMEQLEAARQEVRNQPNSRQRSKVAVTATIRTAGGELPAPDRNGLGIVSIRAQDIRDNHNFNYSGTRNVRAVEGLSFEFDKPASITGVADWEGYAPTVVGPVRIAADQRTCHLEFVLQTGFGSRMRFLNPQKDAIRKATVELRLMAPLNSQPRRFQCDSDGIVTLEHLSELPYRVTITAPGYAQTVLHKVKFKKGQLVTHLLAATPRMSGQVVDAEGKPIAEAKIRLLATQSKISAEEKMGYWEGPMLATTDAEGQFSLTSLRKDMRYSVAIHADEYGIEIREVRPGQSGLVVRLGPERILRGSLVGDLSKLKPKFVGGSSEVPALDYQVAIPNLFSNRAYDPFFNRSGPAEVSIDPDSEGQRGTFELRNLPPGEVTITIGNIKRIIKPFDGLQEGVTIDLEHPAATDPQLREVTIRFVPSAPDLPAPTGEVRITINASGENYERHQQQFVLPVIDGKVEFGAFAPGVVSLGISGLIGYWFDESSIGTVSIRPGVNARGFAVPAGQGAFVRSFPVSPAGAIRCRVTTSDGAVPENLADIRLNCYQQNPAENPHNSKQTSSSLFPGEWTWRGPGHPRSARENLYGDRRIRNHPILQRASHPGWHATGAEGDDPSASPGGKTGAGAGCQWSAGRGAEGGTDPQVSRVVYVVDLAPDRQGGVCDVRPTGGRCAGSVRSADPGCGL